MKTLILQFISISVLFLAVACNDDQEKMFEGEPGLHFVWEDSGMDTLRYSFMNISSNEVVVRLKVELEGYATKENRTFRLETDEAGTTAVEGVHYKSLESSYTLDKDSYSKEVDVTLLYAESLDTTEVRLALVLRPSGVFAPGIDYKQRVTIVSSNLLPYIAPGNWSNFYRTYFGEYSKVKHRYILSELRLSEVVNFEDAISWYFYDRNLKKAYGQTMSNFFAENEIYDEYNQRIQPW